MVIRFLKSNNASAIIFLPLFALLIWAFSFISPTSISIKHTMPLYELVAGIFVTSPIASTITAFLMVVLEAFLINHIINENEVLAKQTYLPSLFYILFMSYSNNILMLHPLLFANLFMLFAINKLLASYRKDKAFSNAFDSGLLISLATLFYFPYLVFFPVLIIGLIVIRPFNWREWVISILGIATPYAFVITFYFWNDALDYLFFDKMFYVFGEKALLPTSDSGFYFIIILISILVVFSIVSILQGVGMGSQRTKTAITLLFWVFLFAILPGLISREHLNLYFSGLAIPASVFCANYFTNIKKQWIAELLFTLLFGSIFVHLIVHFF